MVPVLLSSKKGYIFIQTDKPIYTPNEVVRYRIFTLDHYMRPVSKAIRITTYNSRNVQFPSFPLMSRKVITRTLKIPDIAQPGNWRIEAQFDDSPMYVVSTQFEVKKFVLPSFKVEVKAEEMFYLITKDEFKFKILADHVYGKAVEGMAYVRFEIIDEMKNNTYLRGLEQQLQIKNGVVMSSLTTKMLLENIKPLESMNLVGHHLYMAVTVFETSSGEMEEVELRNIKFVSSPYVIDLSKTSGYFVPRVPFSVLVQVTYPDGSPASGVPVTLEGEKLQLTQENGQVVLSLPSPEAADVLEIKVTAGDGTTGREISKAKKTVRIYQSKTKSYLHVNVPHHVLDPDSSFSADLTAITPAGSGDIKYYYYMIISKGKVLEINRLLKTEFMKIHLSLNIAMVPAFRLVIYYYTNVGGKTEMVANSAWVDVKDVCEGKITIKNMPKEYYRPGRMVTLSVETEDSGSLSLAVVDTAIYILNNKNKLTPNKVFEEMNSYDLGCTFGGGADSVGVFMDAGLTFISNVDTSVIRDGYSCKRDSRRMKRSLDIQAQYVGKVGHYTNSSLRKCCVDGMTAILMKRTCEDRSKRVKEEECRKAFLTCCEFAVELRNNQSRKLDAVGRMAESDGDDFFDETSVHVRSNFPQSWEWRTHPIAHAGVKKINLHLPDSITTWEIQAVGMFEKKGFCVAEPKKMKVFRPVFISLRLPYSVKRNEQLEVRAILYNYHFEDIEMKIYMKPVDVLCSPATGEKHARTVTVRANSAYPIYFSVVPLTIGDIPITVVAYSNTDVTVSDAVTGKLKVLGEGVLKTEDHSIFINPRARSSYHIFEEMPSNIVPDTKSYLYVRARGEVMGETVQNCLTPEGIDRLIKVPKGCAEQTTVLMAPTVFAVKYLDKSDQWLCLKAERKDEALEHIETGYKKILEYKKDDGSYGIYLHRPSSTWLTAFIVKILSIVRSQIDVEKNHIQQSVLYVVNGQRETGEFYDPHPVLDRGMQGGIGGLESNIATTAFVTIALVNSLPSFHGNAENKKQVDESIARAVKYLSNQLADIKRAYVLAITAYALAFVDPDSSVAHEADTKLKQMATYDEDNDVRYWKADEKSSHIGESRPGRVPQASAVTVEATSYALLQTIAMKDLHYAKAIVKWLTEQRKDGGGFRSTQDTVIALEALTEYSIATFMPEEVDMKLTFINPERGPIQTLSIQRNNTLIQDELQFQLGQNISVKVSGKGTGTLTVLKTYHLLAEPTSSCDYFKLEVTVKGKVEYVEHPDYSNYEDYVDPLQRDQPLREIDWFDLRSRRRRDMPDADKDKTIYYEICVWHEPDGDKNQRVSGMAIVDISLLSGFEPDNTDLNKLKNLADRYIDSYEFKDGRVLLYLETVHEYRECVVFGAKQIFPIGLIQPASATLYDYYNPSTKCTVFYNAPEKSTIVSKLCQNDVCECAEGHCPRIKRTFSPDVARDARMDFACYSPIVEYAFIVTVSGISNTGNFDVYKVSIIKRIKLASDESIMVNGIRHFLKRNACPLKLQLHKSYLLMGKDGKTKDANRNIQYVLDSNSWIEEIPPADKCKATKARSTCEKLKKFIADLGTTGCQM